LEFGGEGAGVPALSFLKLPTSARGMGFGAAALTTDEEATMVQGNPALLAMVQDYYYSVSHAEILGEFRHENLAFTLPTPGWGGFGASANILAATAFEDARDIDENPSNPSAYDIAVGLAYGNHFWPGRASAGLRLDLIRSDLDGDAATGYAVSGALLFMLVSDLRLAVAINNLSHGISYNSSSGSPVEPLPLNLGLELGKPLLGSRWSGHAGLAKSNDGILRYYAGAEWRIIRPLVARAGYEGSSQDRELGPMSGLAAGLGVKYDRITFDYGYKILGPLGSYHAFTLNYSRKSEFRARDEILLERAGEKYRQGKYKQALSLARGAVSANPYNLKAQALAQQALIELERLDETAVTLAFTANTEGRFTPEWRDGRPMGGLARRKTKLAQLKESQGRVIVLDAGNLIGTTPPAMEKEKYIFGAYARMPYDAINLGAAELRLGADGLDPRLPFLASQKPLDAPGSGVSAAKTFALKRGAEVMVIGAVDPKSVPGAGAGEGRIEEVARVVRRMADPPKESRILVLLLHGSLTQAHQAAAAAPELDVIILSGESQALGSPMKAGKTLICSPGRGGAHIGELTLRLDKAGRILSFRHFLIPLDTDAPEDAEMKKFLEPVTLDPNRFAMEGYADDYRAQVIAYVRADKPGAEGSIFLRDLGTGRDFPVPAPGLAASRPILGYGKNKVAFLGEDGSGAREVYVSEPGTHRLDTLTRMRGRAFEIRWILGHNALLAAYEKGGESDLLRIDPWSKEVRDLTQGRFGDILGFDMSEAGDRLALNATDEKGGAIWVTTAEAASPVSIARDRGFLGSPRWSPKGDKLAFLTATGEGYGELRVFDFATDKLVSATRESRVRDFSWSADGSRIFYSAGVNLADINAFTLEPPSLAKVTTVAPAPRSEGHPSAKVYGGRDGLLFEAGTEGGRGILWMDLETREEKILTDTAGYNSLR